MPTRLITGYGPQDDAGTELLTAFYSKLEEEIISCKVNDCGIILELDCNAKVGKM